MRVYEFAKKAGISSKELIALLVSNKFDIASHMSILSDEALQFLNSQNKKEQQSKQSAAPVMQKNTHEKKEVIVKPSQVESPATPQRAARKDTSVTVAPVKISRAFSKQPTQVLAASEHAKDKEVSITIEPMTVADFIEKTQKSLAEVIVFLLKKGIVASKNQVINEQAVGDLARHFGVTIIERAAPATHEADTGRLATTDGVEPRMPVVVVVGHVDHGKTTLLDFIRKTRVAAREKGGITQHLGAYEVATKQGKIVFLDTPGHEAFSLIRSRGMRVADIAILVVAADDGVMPQTIEAIKAAQQAKITLIVALNKIDKASKVQIESTKRQLSQHGLMPEEWGGQTVIMSISGKLGTGVEDLLEVVALQANIMELTTRTDVPASGFVLESKLEKGLGCVATVICQQGILHVGDIFLAGSASGRVSALIDSRGKRIKEIRPSEPALVAGFDSLPKAGDLFQVMSQDDMKKKRQEAQLISAKPQAKNRKSASEHTLNIVFKADNASSLEALSGSINKLSGKMFKECNVVLSGVGSITESDVTFAIDTKSVIYGLHVKVEPNALILAQRSTISIKLYDIIYKLIEDLQLVAEEGRPVEKVTKKIGEATVLKVFDIKGLGVIAGAVIRSGRFAREGNVIIYRGKTIVGKGPIKSLQRDKKSVKEVHSGFECAFLIDGFVDWQEDDRVECYLETEKV